MTYPGQGNEPWQQPPGQPPGYPPQGQPPGYPQSGPPGYPQSGPPGYPQQPYPQQGQPEGYPQGYQQQQYPPSSPTPQAPYPGFPGQQPAYQGQQPGYPQPGGAPPAKSKGKRGLIIALVAVPLAAVGTGVTWFAISQSDPGAHGADTPQETVDQFVQLVNQSDLLGMLESLVPAEAAVLAGSTEESFREYKRLKLLDESADPRKLTGVEVRTENLTYGTPEQVNDHLSIVKVTGGKLVLSWDFANLPLAEDFKDAILPPEVRAQMPQDKDTETVDIATDIVQKTGKPLSIATVKVDDEWYPSILYSAAHYALQDQGKQWPSASIPANGAASPNAAINDLIKAALNGDLRRAIELLPPDEMAVLHDVGPVLVDALAQEGKPELPIEFDGLETELTQINGGTRATITKLNIRQPNGPGTFSLTKSGDCYTVVIDGRSESMCADQVADLIQRELGGATFPPDALQAIKNIAKGLLEQGLGIVTTEVDGKHYVSPMRTYNELGMTISRSLTAEDIEAFMRMAR